MREDLTKLIRMQEFDDQIGERETLKEQLPRELDTLKSNLNEAESKVAATKKLLDENVAHQKKKELDIHANKDKMAKYENQLLGVKTNKEYKALNSEITHLKEQNTVIDDEIIEMMEKENGLRAQQKEDQAALQVAQNDLNQNEDKLRARIAQVEKEIESLKQQRTEIGLTLPKQLVQRYVLLIKNKQRKAVVFVENDACSGCGFKIRPQLAIEISRGKKIISCENCGRLMVERPQDE